MKKELIFTLFLLVNFSCSTFHSRMNKSFEHKSFKNCDMKILSSFVDSLFQEEFKNYTEFEKKQFELDSVFLFKFQNRVNKMESVNFVINKFNCELKKSFIQNH